MGANQNGSTPTTESRKRDLDDSAVGSSISESPALDSAKRAKGDVDEEVEDKKAVEKIEESVSLISIALLM